MWIVRFVRKDGKPDEEYYYHTLREAETHKRLFQEDDSDLYEAIEIVSDPIERACINRMPEEVWQKRLPPASVKNLVLS